MTTIVLNDGDLPKMKEIADQHARVGCLKNIGIHIILKIQLQGHTAKAKNHFHIRDPGYVLFRAALSQKHCRQTGQPKQNAHRQPKPAPRVRDKNLPLVQNVYQFDIQGQQQRNRRAEKQQNLIIYPLTQQFSHNSAPKLYHNGHTGRHNKPYSRNRPSLRQFGKKRGTDPIPIPAG